MKTLSYRSTNGRWGTDVLVPDNASKPYTGLLALAEQEFYSAGKVGQIQVFKLRNRAGNVAILGNDLSVYSGDGDVLAGVGLQSSASVTLINARPGTIVRDFGYKRRSSVDYLVTETGTRTIPAAEVLDLVAQHKAAREATRAAEIAVSESAIKTYNASYTYCDACVAVVADAAGSLPEQPGRLLTDILRIRDEVRLYIPTHRCNAPALCECKQNHRSDSV